MNAPMGFETVHRFIRASVRKPICAVSLVLLGMDLLAGCTPHYDALKLDPGVDFAAHVDHRGLVVDRMDGDAPAVLVPHGALLSGGPDFLLEFNDRPIAALWLADSNHIIVRQAPDRNARVIGRVETTSQQEAIRLAFQSPDGTRYSTGRFHRLGEIIGPALLGPEVSTSLDLRGEYRAEVRNAQGTPIGWLRVRIETDPGTTRVYDGVLPEQLDGPLGVAAAELVNAEVDDIERQAVDVYQGD